MLLQMASRWIEGAPVRSRYGTCFYIGDNYFLTAGHVHVLEYADDAGRVAIIERQEGVTRTNFHRLSVDSSNIEHWKEIDLALLKNNGHHPFD